MGEKSEKTHGSDSFRSSTCCRSYCNYRTSRIDKIDCKLCYVTYFMLHIICSSFYSSPDIWADAKWYPNSLLLSILSSSSQTRSFSAELIFFKSCECNLLRNSACNFKISAHLSLLFSFSIFWNEVQTLDLDYILTLVTWDEICIWESHLY